MKLVVNNSALVLDRWQTVELVDAAGATAVVDKGCVWITMEKDRRDIVLGAGQSFTVARNGRTLLHAERPSALRIVERPVRDTLKTVGGTIGLIIGRARDAAERWAVRAIERNRVVPYY
jgi:hypothetical protein